MGVISLVIKENKYKPVPSNKYARLDLVIVDNKFRHNGVGRLLLLAGITYLLKNSEEQLYSSSCLATHKMVENVLTEFSF
ncbi:MAG TPA: hypothetical protein DCX78_06025 [Nitrospina sp.]|nr:hypothetical protein [Nitrospina sp.]